MTRRPGSIVTLEDLLEEIVGEINDEYDEESRSQITEESGGTYLLDGMLAVRDANRRFQLKLDEEAGYTTVAGFLLAKAGLSSAPARRSSTTAPASRSRRLTAGASDASATPRPPPPPPAPTAKRPPPAPTPEHAAGPDTWATTPPPNSS